MMISYVPKGVCARKINIELDEAGENILKIFFTGGCNGNAQGVSALAKGRPVTEVAELLQGIECGDKGTSCPAQAAEALKKI